MKIKLLQEITHPKAPGKKSELCKSGTIVEVENTNHLDRNCIKYEEIKAPKNPNDKPVK